MKTSEQSIGCAATLLTQNNIKTVVQHLCITWIGLPPWAPLLEMADTFSDIMYPSKSMWKRFPSVSINAWKSIDSHGFSFNMIRTLSISSKKFWWKREWFRIEGTTCVILSSSIPYYSKHVLSIILRKVHVWPFAWWETCNFMWLVHQIIQMSCKFFWYFYLLRRI